MVLRNRPDKIYNLKPCYKTSYSNLSYPQIFTTIHLVVAKKSAGQNLGGSFDLDHEGNVLCVTHLQAMGNYHMMLQKFWPILTEDSVSYSV